MDIDCCDLDGDGDLDLVTANRQISEVGVFINQSTPGTMQLAPRAPYDTGLAPWGVRCLELSGDSRPDVVTSNYTSEGVSVLVNLGSGTSCGGHGHPHGSGRDVYIVGGVAVIDVTLATGGLPTFQADIAAAFVDGVALFQNVCLASGDADGDGDVDLRDFAFLLTCFGFEPGFDCLAFDHAEPGLLDLGDVGPWVALLGGPVEPGGR